MLRSHVHAAAKARDGDELAVDAASIGDPVAKATMIVSSGTHGVEGRAGSGIQSAWLCDAAIRSRVEATGVRLLLIHAVNPWGFAYDARTDENNVDVNRNFRDFSRPPTPNADYARLHPWLVPPTWPPPWTSEARLVLEALGRGKRSLQSAIARGQCEFADGLFYGGATPSWSRSTLEALVADAASGSLAVGWIDIHTGLGVRGSSELIHNGRHDVAALARARRWWGDAVTSIHEGASVSAEVVGANFMALERLSIARSAAVTLEIGTRPAHAVLDALRARQWLYNHPDASGARAESIRAGIRKAFFIDDDAWIDAARESARRVLLDGIDALHREVATLQ